MELPELKIELPESKLRLPEWTLRLQEACEETNRHLLAIQNLTDVEYRVRLSGQEAKLKERNYTHSELLNLAAALILEEEINDLQIQFNDSKIDAQELMIEYLNVCIEDQKRIIETAKKLGELGEICSEAAETIEEKCRKYKKKKAADIGHDQEGGSRDKQEKMRAVFATGKYKNNRDECAENECKKIGMSFSTARKALRNTPNPT